MKTRRLILLLLWIVSLVCISFFGGTVSFVFFFSLTTMIFILFGYIFLVYIFFSIYQRISGRTVVCRQTTDYYFTLHNGAPFAFSGLRVSLFEENFKILDLPQKIEYEFLPGEKVEFTTKIACEYRGTYDIGVRSIDVADFLNIFHWKFKLPTTIQAIVLPRVIELEKLKSIEDIYSVSSRDNFSGNSSLDTVVRDYVRGDSMRQIHWKASAKSGELKSRTYYDEGKNNVMLYYDGKRFFNEEKLYLPIENNVLEAVLAVTSFMVKQNVPVRVEYGYEKNLETQVVADSKTFENFYQWVSENNFQKDFDEIKLQELFCEKCLSEMPKIAFLVLHKLDERIIALTTKMTEQGIFVVIYLISDENSAFGQISNARRQIVRVGSKDDLEYIL